MNGLKIFYFSTIISSQASFLLLYRASYIEKTYPLHLMLKDEYMLRHGISIMSTVSTIMIIDLDKMVLQYPTMNKSKLEFNEETEGLKKEYSCGIYKKHGGIYRQVERSGAIDDTGKSLMDSR